MATPRVLPHNINTEMLFSVQSILLSRGFEVVSEDDVTKLLITEDILKTEIWEKLYDVFDNTKYRTELKKFLYQAEQVSSKEVREIIDHPKFIKNYQMFNSTFEWYAGKLMVKRFAAFSSSFGVTVKDIMRNTTSTAAGDYDSLVVLRDTNLAYFECKAGDYDNTSIMKCYERMLSLNCEYSILFCEKSIQKDKIVWETSRVRIPVVGVHQLNRINVKGNEVDVIYDLNNCYIIDLTGNIENKIRTVLRVNAAKINQLHFAIGLDNKTYGDLGYDMVNLDQQYYSEIHNSEIKI